MLWETQRFLTLLLNESSCWIYRKNVGICYKFVYILLLLKHITREPQLYRSRCGFGAYQFSRYVNCFATHSIFCCGTAMLVHCWVLSLNYHFHTLIPILVIRDRAWTPRSTKVQFVVLFLVSNYRTEGSIASVARVKIKYNRYNTTLKKNIIWQSDNNTR